MTRKIFLRIRRRILLIQYCFFRLSYQMKTRLKSMVQPANDLPVLYNVNTVDESVYTKRALFIWRVTPFLIREDDQEFLRHQNLRQCQQIAALLGEFGYIVDVADIKDRKFSPSREYDLIISTKVDLKYAHTTSPKNARKIFLALTLSNIMHNRNLRRRHALLYKRRKCRVRFRKLVTEEMPDAPKSDAIVGFGNEFILRTWQEVFPGPTYPFNNYGYNGTEFPLASKDFSAARRNFLFFASRCQIQKGLDLLLEIFPKYPHLHLYVCSYFEMERDFCACYYQELYETPNIHPIGWITVNSPAYAELVQRCAYVIHPTCSEGQAGSVVQCMHSGLIPLVTREAGIDTEDFGITFADDSLEEIERVIVDVSQRPENWHSKQSMKTRKVAKQQYSEEAFMANWRTILTELK